MQNSVNFKAIINSETVFLILTMGHALSLKMEIFIF